MQRTIHTIKNLVFAFAIFNLATGCKTTQQPVTSKNVSTIRASIDLVNVTDDKVKVEIQIDNLSLDTISYYLPKIVPGTYQNNNFGKYIDDLKAFDHEGNSIYVQKDGDNRWKITNAKQLDKITYWVNDTFDSESSHDVFSPTGSNIIKDKNYILNLYAFVGYFGGMEENKYKLFIKHPSFLEASASIEEILFDNATNTSKNDIDYFSFKRYADVVDNPIMYSSPDKASFKVNDIEVLLSVYSKNKTHKAARIMPQMERMIRAQKDFLGDINSTKKYSILLYLSSAKSDDAHGFGALEHNTSTVVVLPESLSHEKLNEALIDVVSHEFFHIVTPLTIHSKEIHNFDYNSPKMSEHLWLYEGTTEYFSMLFQITQGLITKDEFFERIVGKIEASSSFDDSIAFTTMSKNILVDPYRNSYRNVYEKGALISMCLDIIMREKSDGVYGLLDLIKNLSVRYGIDVPFDDKELINAIEEDSYPEVSAFLQTHVMNNTPIDYEFYLNKAGVLYGIKNAPSSYFIFKQDPFVTGSEATKEVIFTSDIPFNSFLKELGILEGDVLLSINKKEYNLNNIYDLFGDSNKWKIGDEITFRIKRNNEIMTLKSNVTKPTIEKIILEQDPKISEQQKMLLKKWIND
ncbi:M61 family metallopeptidase [Aquimarina macrocephali]|uniref:M61 family metallopeptidase n=1 Tax=Aquimarina macrocephali TaxID=666563 RepID=UPI0004B30BB2|nr:peptidase M61 [Aquimarina macrocephali]